MVEPIWHKARKKPVVIEFREPIVTGLYPPDIEYIEERTEEKRIVHRAEKIETKEGTMFAIEGIDYVIRGVEGELYPIKKEIFNKTYHVIEESR